MLLAAGAVAGAHRGDREMACGGPYPRHRASAVVVVRVAQRGVGHVRRDRRRAVVRPGRHRHAGDEPVAAGARREDRPRRVVRDVLAARGRPGHARRRAPPSTAAAWCRPTCSTTAIMRMDTVVLEEGATLGPHCVALPAARIGAGATVGPASLVMRGDEVPPSTRWQGNPIAPWNAFRKKRDDTPPRPQQRKPPRDPVARRRPRSASRHRPVPARQRQLRLPGVALRTRPRVQGGSINRLAGTATITAVTLAALRTFTLDLSDALTVSKVSVNGRRPAQFRRVARQAAHHAVVDAARGCGDDDRRALRRNAATDPIALG